jgi:hypothetical protein
MSRCLRVRSYLFGEQRPDAAGRVCVSTSFSFISFVGVQMRVGICDSGIAVSSVTEASEPTEGALPFELLEFASISGCFSLSMSAGKKSTYIFATVAIWQNWNLDPAIDAHVGPDDGGGAGPWIPLFRQTRTRPRTCKSGRGGGDCV